MKRAAFLLGLLALASLAAPQQARAAFACGTTSLSTTNPSSTGRYTWVFTGVVTYHGNYSVRTDLDHSSNGWGLARVVIEKPDEISDGTNWPMVGSSRFNGSSAQLTVPYGTAGLFYYFEGVTSFSGPYDGGSITISANAFSAGGNSLHTKVGTFSTTGNTFASYVTYQTLRGMGIPCPAASPRQLASSFNYQISMSGGIWRQGTVSNYQPSGSPYLQLTLSNPYSTGAWLGNAACMVDTQNYLDCTVQTGDAAYPTGVGDPIMTQKLIVSPYYMFTYCQGWWCENDGNWFDVWNY